MKKLTAPEWMGIIGGIVVLVGTMIGVVRHIDGIELRIYLLEQRERYVHGEFDVPSLAQGR